MSKLDNKAVSAGMKTLDEALPGITPEVITALTFIMIDRAVAAGLTLQEIQENVRIAFDTHPLTGQGRVQ